MKMTDTRIKWNIIKNGRKLREIRNETISKLRIVLDLTKKEREADKKLVRTKSKEGHRRYRLDD